MPSDPTDKPRATRPKRQLAQPATDAIATLQQRGGLGAWRARLGLSLAQAAAEIGLADRQSVRKLSQPGATPSATLARLALALEDGLRPMRPRAQPDRTPSAKPRQRAPRNPTSRPD